ncbi:MAG: N-acetyltransferase [Pirellulaceae bacterium]|jgi:hypothetical protein|nr:N-acetyltransferase [Pirellulaceae bacterium]MDP7018772.1 N-acetyltransferase [Pirellulaceae bacterium]
MSELTVKPVATRAERKQFLQLPWRIYQGDPNWIPPLRQNQKELVGFAPHPFYDRNERQAFLAVRDGRAVGRILAIVDRAHIDRYGEQLGFFGFFESEDDPAIAAGLFDAARGWLKERGLERIRGPVNPSMNYECGLLIEGFDSPPTFMMTYNPPHYAAAIEAVGLSKVQDLFAFWGHVEMLDTLDKKLAFVVEEATRRFNISLRRMDTKRFDTEVRMFLDIYNQSMGANWGFTPLSDNEITHMAKSLKHLIVPEMTSIAEVDGKPVGAVFAMLDYNPRIKSMDGKLFPFGFIKLLWNRRRIKTVRMIATNVVPEYQRFGVGLVVMARLVPEVLAWGIQDVEFSWVLESNNLSFKTLKRGGARVSKKYRIYDSDPTADSSGVPVA